MDISATVSSGNNCALQADKGEARQGKFPVVGLPMTVVSLTDSSLLTVAPHDGEEARGLFLSLEGHHPHPGGATP